MTPEGTFADALWRMSEEDQAVLTLAPYELRAWNDRVRERFIAGGLLEPGTPASRVVCPECESGHVEEVEWFDDIRGGRHAAIRCPEVGRVELPLEALSTWRLVPGALVNEIARLLEAAGAREVVPRRVWSIGPIGAGNRELLIVRGRSWAPPSADGELTFGDPFVAVFSNADRASENDLVLTDILGWTGDTLTIDRDRLVSAAQRRFAHGALDGTFAFVRDQTGWMLAFGGNAFHLGHLMGLADIHTLLSRPHETLLAYDLVGGRLVEDGLEMVDELMLSDLRAKLRTGGPDANSAKIHQFLRLATNRAGGARSSPSPLSKAATTVRNRIGTAVKEIRRTNPAMATHLRESIKTGIDVRYAPKKNLDWSV